MSIPDDQPPPSTYSQKVMDAIQKLQNKSELADYSNHIVYLHAHQLEDITIELKEKLLLQGLDDDDLHNIHSFLYINFDGDIIKTPDYETSKKQLETLTRYLNL